MTIKALVIGADANVGGISSYVFAIASNSDPEIVEWHMTINAPNYIDLENPVDRIKKHYFPINYSMWSLPAVVYKLRGFLIKQHFDLLHLHAGRAGLLGCLASTGLPIAIVYTGHGWGFDHKKTILERTIFYFLERYICYRATIVSSISQRHNNIAIKKGLVDPNKAITINTRIDKTLFEDVNCETILKIKRDTGIPEDALVVGTVARMVDMKDPFTFIHVANCVHKTFPNSYFLWVGDGESKEKVVDLAMGLGIEDHLIITGFRSKEEVSIFLHIMDVYLCTSLIEGMPLSILEAHAAKRPVISSSYPGVEEVVNHGKTGFIYQTGNYTEAATLVIQIISDKEKTKKIVMEAYKEFLERNSDPVRMSQDYEDVYVRAIMSLKKNRYLINN